MLLLRRDLLSGAKTFRNVEILVVVDGPDEKTLDALGQIGDSRA